MKRKLTIGASIIGLSALLFFGFVMLQKPADEVKAGSIIREANLLGTGTSTAGTFNFNAAATTTSNVIVVGPSTDTVDIDIYPESASSTAHMQIEIMKTSLTCAAASANNHDWVDALSYNTTSGNLTTLSVGTSTIEWQPSAEYELGRRIQLTNVNGRCLKLYVGGQAVNLYIQAVLKTLSY